MPAADLSVWSVFRKIVLILWPGSAVAGSGEVHSYTQTTGPVQNQFTLNVVVCSNVKHKCHGDIIFAILASLYGVHSDSRAYHVLWTWCMTLCHVSLCHAKHDT